MSTSLDPRALAAVLRAKLSHKGESRVVWDHEGDAVLVHLDGLAVQLRPGIITVVLPLETDQSGRRELRSSFALGVTDGQLLGVTESVPDGDPLLVARWGDIVHEALWAALVAVIDDERSAATDLQVAIEISRDRALWAWSPRRRQP